MMLDETQYVPESSNKHFLGYLPNITASLTAVAMNPFNYTGAFSVGNSSGTVPGPNSGQIQRRYVDFNASRCSETYGKGGLTFNNVIPASISIKEIIRYI